MKKPESSKRPFLSFEEACEYLSVKPATLYSYTSKRILRFYKVNGRKIYFLKEDLVNFVINDRNLVKSQRQIEEEAKQHLREMRSGGVK